MKFMIIFSLILASCSNSNNKELKSLEESSTIKSTNKQIHEYNTTKNGYMLNDDILEEVNETILWGWNCKTDYNPDFCAKDKKFYIDNYDYDL